MCLWVGPHLPSFGRQLLGLPSRVEYLSPQGVLPPLVYRRTASPCGLICGASLLGRQPPPGLCTGSPVTGCFHCSG